MKIEKTLRDLVKTNGLRKTARDLGINHGNLYRSLMDGSNLGLNRIEAILDYFGYELIIRRKEVKGVRGKSLRKSTKRR